jgi:tetratricopeptide (TPR) repeat protein
MKRIAVILSVLVFIAACNSSETFRKEIEKKETALMESAKKSKADTAAINALLTDYETYADKYPSDTMGANYLFKAADFNRYMQKPLRSIQIYSKIYDNYPKIDKRPYALFLQGFMYENELTNITAAKGIYEKFLKEYPSHPISSDVQITLDNLGKTPEQMLEEFIAKQQADSLAKAGN